MLPKRMISPNRKIPLKLAISTQDGIKDIGKGKVWIWPKNVHIIVLKPVAT